MSLFKSEEERELDRLLLSIEMNQKNNYKDAAQEDYRDFVEVYEKACAEGKLKEKKRAFYESKKNANQVSLGGYTHKDQKPYWTK